jgi:hypothetical protein
MKYIIMNVEDAVKRTAAEEIQEFFKMKTE